MKGVISIMKKDYLLMRYNKPVLASIILWLPVLMLIPIVDSYLIIMMGSFMLLMMTFGIESVNRELINSLPVRRRDTILSKYIMLFINSILLILYMWSIYFIFKQFNVSPIGIINWNVILTILTIVIYIYSFFISISENFPGINIAAWPMILLNLFRRITGYYDIDSIELMVGSYTVIIIGAIAVFTVSILISLYKCRGRKGWR